MRSLSSLVLVVLLFLTTSSCGVLMHRKVVCRPVPDQVYSFARSVHVPSVIEYKSSEGRTKRFILSRNDVNHTQHYFSDTGCGCVDYSAQAAYSMEGDTLIVYAKNVYIEKNPNTVNYGARCSLGGLSNFMGTSNLVSTDTLSQGHRRITFRARTDEFPVQEIIIEEHRGITQFTMQTGEVWTIVDPEAITNRQPVFEVHPLVCPSNGRPNMFDPFVGENAPRPIRYE